jgi:GTP-binding protein HflX
VGFIRNLPANLIESFRSTLEDIQNADYIVHVVDISARDIDTNIRTVNDELNALECLQKPVILFFNKTDLISDDKLENTVSLRYPGAITGSVHAGKGMDDLKKRWRRFRKKSGDFRLPIP